MRAWSVLLASVAVHAVALWAVAEWWHARPELVIVEAPPAALAVEIVPPPAVAPQVIEVAFLGAEAPAPAALAVVAAPARASHVAAVAHAASGVSVATETGSSTSTSTTSETGRRHLGMRGPELHPSDETLGHIAEQTGHAGTTPIPSHRIEDAPGGRAVIHDEVTDIAVDRDGTAHLHDKPDIDVHIAVNPLAIISNLKGAGKLISDWAEDPEAGKRYGRTQDLSRANQASPGGCGWGDPMCDDPEAPDADKAARKRGGAGQAMLFGIAGKLDITSYLMRKLGVGDAYDARKMKALDDTRLERAEQGGKYKEEQLAHASQLMQQNLERVWSGTRDPDERKVVLFELWDECVEGEGVQAEAGARARMMVIGWIRAHIPAGTHGAYTPQDLAALDAHRTSHAHFAPYD